VSIANRASVYNNFMIEFDNGWTLFDHRDRRGRNAIKEWTWSLEKKSLAKLHRKLEILEQTGPDLAPGLLKGTKERHIDKIKIEGRVSHALLVCRGPIAMHEEMTLLIGAQEQDRKLPKGTEALAENVRSEIIASPLERRCLHEHISWPFDRRTEG
jgi:hypothetical protein